MRTAVVPSCLLRQRLGSWSALLSRKCLSLSTGSCQISVPKTANKKVTLLAVRQLDNIRLQPLSTTLEWHVHHNASSLFAPRVVANIRYLSSKEAESCTTPKLIGEMESISSEDQTDKVMQEQQISSYGEQVGVNLYNFFRWIHQTLKSEQPWLVQPVNPVLPYLGEIRLNETYFQVESEMLRMLRCTLSAPDTVIEQHIWDSVRKFASLLPSDQVRMTRQTATQYHEPKVICYIFEVAESKLISVFTKKLPVSEAQKVLQELHQFMTSGYVAEFVTAKFPGNNYSDILKALIQCAIDDLPKTAQASNADSEGAGNVRVLRSGKNITL